MQISVVSPIFQTWIFAAILFVALLVSAVKIKENKFFPIFLSNELKGLAILFIVLSHVGYFLSKNTDFLFPLSVFAGAGVNLFLFLSGYGLTISTTSEKNQSNVGGFYKKRLSRLYLPMWLVISSFFILDSLLLGKGYEFQTIAKSFLGLFSSADLYQDLDSPLWYFTLILFYYLILPWTLRKRFILFSPLIVLLISYLFAISNLLIGTHVISLYKLHFWAFPLGMSIALVQKGIILNNLKTFLKKLISGFQIHPSINTITRYGTIFIMLVIVGYTAINSGVGKGLEVEQFISLITVAAIILLFILKPLKFNFLGILGIYSYEIYLIHWPILYRYDFLYKYLPASLATSLYLIMFLIIGYIIQKLNKRLLKTLM